MRRFGLTPGLDDSLRLVSIFCAASATMLAATCLVSCIVYGTAGGLDARLLVAVRWATVANVSIGGSLRQIMACATALGAFPTLALIVLFAAGLLMSNSQRKAALLLIVRSGGGIGAANLLKRVVDRPRPTIVEHWTTFSSSSFPSGHTADGTVVYLLLATIAAEQLRTSKSRRYVMACAIALPMLIGMSRVFLGVHWPTDVIGGWFFGSAWVLACLSWKHKQQV